MSRFLPLAAALLLAACGSDSPPRDPVESLLALCEAMAAERCDQVERCGAHPAACVSEGCDAPAWQRAVARIEQGRVRFDHAAAADCLKLMHDQCVPAHPACGNVLVGSVKPGGACGTTNDCAGEASCVIEDSCPGTCMPLPAVGEACVWGLGVPCVDGAYCDGGTCAAFVGEGGACNGEHAAGSIVVSGGGGHELPPEPEPGRVLCDRGLRCEDGRCVEPVRGLKPAPLPEVGLGEACGTSPLERTASCAGDLFCDDRTGRCAEPGDEGDSCPQAMFYASGELPCVAGLECFAGACTRRATPAMARAPAAREGSTVSTVSARSCRAWASAAIPRPTSASPARPKNTTP